MKCVKRKIKTIIWDGPNRGKVGQEECYFDSKEIADNFERSGVLLISPVTGGSFYRDINKTSGAGESPLPYVGLGRGTRRKPGRSPYDFCHSAFKNVETRRCPIKGINGVSVTDPVSPIIDPISTSTPSPVSTPIKEITTCSVMIGKIKMEGSHADIAEIMKLLID